MTVGNAGGNWFDYSAVSPLEGSPGVPFSLQARVEEGERMSESQRNPGIGGWEDVGVLEMSAGGRRSGVGNGYTRSTRNSTIGQADQTGSRWISVPHGEVSSEV